ncbi:MAG: hypothetical protein ACI9R3_006033 [Verrucomicrobiales bacterium]|jgi:hypothetical protein
MLLSLAGTRKLSSSTTDWIPTGKGQNSGVPTLFPTGGVAVVSPDPGEAELQEQTVATIDEECYIRSTREVLGYNILATDEDIGHVEDFIVDTERWRLRYLVIDTTNWLPGKKVLVDIDWLKGFNWSSRSAAVGMTKEQIENAWSAT